MKILSKPHYMKNEFYDSIVQSAQGKAAYLSQRQNRAWGFELQRQIEKAFKGVKCLQEKNVLLGSAALDDGCYTSALMEDLHKREERRDWSKISPAMLLACDDALYYLGVEGFRFLMPAYMILCLKYRIPELTALWLCAMSGISVRSGQEKIGHYSKRFELFSQKQMEAVQKWFSDQRRMQHSECPYSENNVPFFALGVCYADFLEDAKGLSAREYLKLSSL